MPRFRVASLDGFPMVRVSQAYTAWTRVSERLWTRGDPVWKDVRLRQVRSKISYIPKT